MDQLTTDSGEGSPVHFPEASGSVPRRRTALLVIIAVVVAAVFGGGAYAAYTMLSGSGPRPADVLPDSTVAAISVDLDPSAGQKVAAFRTLRKVPELKERLASADDDLRRLLVNAIVSDGACKGIDFDKDVKPWLGKRAAVAAVDLGEKSPTLAVVLQFTDKTKAAAGYERFAKCDGGENGQSGFALGKDYLIGSDTTAHAQKILADGEQKPLADDPAYRTWTEEAGGQGVLSFYVGAHATDYLVDRLDSLSGRLGGLTGSEDLGGAGSSVPAADADCEPITNPFATAEKSLRSFRGLAGALRFSGDGLDLSVATSGVGGSKPATVGDQVGALPQGTAIAGGVGIPGDLVTGMVKKMTACPTPFGDPLVALEAQIGLDLPDELATLLGSAVTFAVSGGQPAGTPLSEIPFAVLLHGDGTAISQLIPKVEAAVGTSLADVPLALANSATMVSASNDAEYGRQILAAKGLGSSSVFKEAVPHADRASVILFADFAAGGKNLILDLLKSGGLPADDVTRAEDYLTPLRAFGLSTWVEGKASHVQLKLTTN